MVGECTVPCRHDEQLPEGDVVVYDSGAWGSTSSRERVDEAGMWAAAHGRKVLGEFVEPPHSRDLVDFGNAARVARNRRTAGSWCSASTNTGDTAEVASS